MLAANEHGFVELPNVLNLAPSASSSFAGLAIERVLAPNPFAYRHISSVVKARCQWCNRLVDPEWLECKSCGGPQ